MSAFCCYLTLVFIVLFIWRCSSLEYSEFGQLKYIILDQPSSNTPHFYSSLFDSKGNIDHVKLKPHSRERRGTTDQLFRRNSSSSAFGSVSEYELHGDNHTVAFLHWSGSKSQVIFIYTSNYDGIRGDGAPGGNVYFESAYLWRSTDYGTSFIREDQSKFTQSSSINGISFCDRNNQRVIVFDQTKKLVYVSDDEGYSYKVNTVPFTPYDIMCIGNAQHNLLLAYDADTKKLFYSSKGGSTNTWHFVSSKVFKYYWVPEITGINSTKIFIETQSKDHHYYSELKYAVLPCDSSDVKTFDPNLGEFEAKSLEFKGKYLFVKKRYPSVTLYVSYNGTSFKKAKFPLMLREQDYHIFDATDDEVLVVVRHEGSTFNLYISDQSGTKYAVSLFGVLASSSNHWKKQVKLADIHKVKGVRGVFLANTIRPDHIIQTFITFDKGGTWNKLRVPAGHKKSCHQSYPCSLNLHMIHSMKYYRITSIMSSQSAMGLIMAQGNVGVTLTNTPDVFLSTDGGLTWSMVLGGFNDFVFGDHGGLIVAVPLKTFTKTVMYSCTEGNNWNSITLEENIKAYGLVTEPGETTLIANIFGQHFSDDFEWLSVKLNLSSVFPRKCDKQDYTTWIPNDERMKGECLMGEIMSYERRQANVSCFNGDEYDREISSASCNCSLEDFMCDFGFIKTSNIGECYSLGDQYIVPEICPELTTYMRTSGYRKVPGDRCNGGIEDNFKANETLCPVQAPSGLSIVLKNSILPSHSPNIFNLVQEKGSTETTWYVWDFGDSTLPVTLTGIDKAKKVTHIFTEHGEFNVTITANNSVGQDTTKVVVKVVDEIVKIRIIPPHGVLVDEEAKFNVTLYSNHKSNWESNHGFVHFVWTFDVSQREKLPLLTWERVVTHKYTKAGKYQVKVNSINDISRQSCTVIVNVHDELRIVQLSFDEQLDKENKYTLEWRDEFAKMLLYELVRVLYINKHRLEVSVLPSVPSTFVDVVIIKRDLNDSLTMDQAVEKLKTLVAKRRLSVTFPDNKHTVATYAEVIDRTSGKKRPSDTTNDKLDIRLPISIGVAALIVVLFLAGIIFYVYRRYSWLYRRYHRLSMANGGDGFVPLNRGSNEINLNDEAVSYHVSRSEGLENMEDSDDELLLDDLGPTGQVLVIHDDVEQSRNSVNA